MEGGQGSGVRGGGEVEGEEGGGFTGPPQWYRSGVRGENRFYGGRGRPQEFVWGEGLLLEAYAGDQYLFVVPSAFFTWHRE